MLRKPSLHRFSAIRLFRGLGIASISLFLLFHFLNILFPLSVDLDYSKVILDKEGQVLHSFLTKDDKWRMFTELDEISPLLSQAIRAKEDKHFRNHFGVNPPCHLPSGIQQYRSGETYQWGLNFNHAGGEIAIPKKEDLLV